MSPVAHIAAVISTNLPPPSKEENKIEGILVGHDIMSTRHNTEKEDFLKICTFFVLFRPIKKRSFNQLCVLDVINWILTSCSQLHRVI